jgi:hypothetical protein
MDEMQLLRALGDETPLASAQDLASAREKVLARTHRRPRRRIAVYGATVAGLAAAIFAVFALIPGSNGGGGPTANADPVQVLRMAAAAALEVPDVTPRPDQFLYTKIQDKNGGTREDWLSIDGTHDGFYRENGNPEAADTTFPGCRDGKRAVLTGNRVQPGQTEECEPDPAYLPDLPTDADGMVAYLRKKNDGSLNSTAKDMLFLLERNYLRPQIRAAIFGAASKIDGLTMDPNGHDAAGRPGIKIAWDRGGYSGGFVVDAKTYAFLGDPEWGAQVAYTIVDKAGQTP